MRNVIPSSSGNLKALIYGFAVLIVTVGSVEADTYYIDYETGSDANIGRVKDESWKRHPFMRGFSGNYSHSAGDRFIFKGGVVWPVETMSFYITKGGTSTKWDYHGVDKTWFKGSEWSRPVFDCDGQAITDSRSSNRSPIFIRGAEYVVVDNIEIREYPIDATWFSACAGVGITASGHVSIKNCYLHDWVVRISQDGKWGGIANWGGSHNLRADGCIIKGPTSIDAQFRSSSNGMTSGAGTTGWITVVNCDISGTTQGTFSAASVSYSRIHNGGNSFRNEAHENGAWVGNSASFIGNKMHDWEEGTAVYVVPGWAGNGGLSTVVNNVVWDTGPVPVSISKSGNSASNPARVRIHNNTLVGSGACIRMAQRPDADISEMSIRNNLLITNGGTPISLEDTVGTLTQTNNVILTTAEATARGLTKPTEYRPLSVVAELAGQGVDLTSFGYPYDIDRIPRDAGWDVGAYEHNSGAGSPPQPPSETGASVEAIDEVRLVWSDNSIDETGFRIERATGADGSFDLLGSVDAGVTSYLDETLSPATMFRYRVQAFNPFGVSEYSSIVEISTDAIPTPDIGEFLDADEGVVTAPFYLQGGALVQGLQTMDLTGGVAEYVFVTQEAGEYAVVAEIDAPNIGQNSFFVGINDSPEAPNAVWHTPVTNGFEFHPASWQGSGVSTPEFVPKYFELGVGEQTVIIGGREPNTKLRRIAIIKRPVRDSPPLPSSLSGP